MQNQKTLLAGVALFAAAGLAGAAQAGSTLAIDLNNFSVTSAATSDGYTLSLFDDDNTEIENIRINDVDANGFNDPFTDTAVMANFVGELQLVGDANSGRIVGGFYELSGRSMNMFSFDNISGTYENTGTGIQLAFYGRSNTGDFATDEFAGVDVSEFDRDDLSVAMLGFFFNTGLLTNPGSTDTIADTDILVTIPSPTAATAGLGLMGLMAAGKRRRRA